MITFESLPPFLKERFLAMPENVREALLSTLDQGWVDCQVAGHEIVKGLEEGKWTIEDMRKAIRKETV